MLHTPQNPDDVSIDTLADEFAQKCRSGGCPSMSQYIEQYPDLADAIHEIFPTIAMMEQLGRKEETQRADTRRQLEIEKRLLDRLGDYRIVREVGRGGMGVVYEAIQESLGRTVALKVLTANVARAPKQLKRFRREAQAAAMLHHTNIVPIFGVGHDDGLHYYVMQYIDGVGLDQVIAQQRLQGSDSTFRLDDPNAPPKKDATLTWQRIGAYGIQIAQAVDYAHHQGILHRDIKPANLLVDAHDAVWVTDFGLAKVFGEDGLTQSGDVMGTARYMAPEQFQGHSTAASDIYSIGVTLYELATAQPAFETSDAKQTMLSITRQGMPRPRLINRAIPQDLETIILKAAAFDPRHRYSSANALADDLERFSNGESIAARRTSLARRMWRWSCRNPALAAMSSLSILLLLLVAVTASIGWMRVEDAHQEALQLASSEQRRTAELRVANQRARDESDRARDESQRAEDNLQLAMLAFEDVIDRVSSRGLPESLQIDLDDEARNAPPTLFTNDDAELLQSLLSFYEDFALRNHGDESVQLETAKAHHRIGDIRKSLGQFSLALSAYDEASTIYQRSAETASADGTLPLAIAAVHNQRGLAFIRNGQAREAMEAHIAAQDLLLAQPPTVRDTSTCRFALATTYNHLGAVWSQAELSGLPTSRRGPALHFNRVAGVGDGRRALLAWMQDNYRQAQQLLDQLIAEEPQNASYRLALARCHRNCLPLASHGGDAHETAACLAASVDILRKLAADFPDSPRYSFELADVLSIDKSELRETPFGESDWQRLEEAEHIARNLNNTYPNQPEYTTLWANALYRFGVILDRNSQRSLAIRHLAESLKHYEDLLNRFPDTPAYVVSMSHVAHDLGTMQREAGLLGASRRTLDNAIMRLIATYDPEADMRSARRLAGMLQMNLNRTTNALQTDTHNEK